MGRLMDWEELGPEGDSNPNALTTAEVAAKWEVNEDAARERLKALEAKGLVIRVKTTRRDEIDRIYSCWGWVIAENGQAGADKETK